MPVQRFLLRLWLAAAGASALYLDVTVHYPERGSAAEYCGFSFNVATTFNDPAAAVPAVRLARDTFVARVELPDSRLYEKAVVGVLADMSPEQYSSPECQARCPRMGSQGQAMQSGAFTETEPLQQETVVEVWPAFCSGDWTETNTSFFSSAIGRRVDIVTRVPAALVENDLPRPSQMLPPVIFRLNSEWYWPDSARHFNTWHDLMVSGNMEFLTVAEVYIEGVNWKDWDRQPIYTTGPLRWQCGRCSPELQFICDSWETSAYFVYRGGEHSFGRAGPFFDEIYTIALPSVLGQLPRRADNTTLRVGVWGYCIGGLAAWNALALRPDRFNVAYLGSPAMDFNCGEPLRAVQSLHWGGVRPRIYIDSGAAEGQVMNRMSLILFRSLEAQGLVEGQDLFYERAEFGTHQASAFLRRSLKGLLVLFGAGRAGREVYTRTTHQVPIIVQPDNMTMGGQWFSGMLLFVLNYLPTCLLLLVGAVALFSMGRLSKAWEAKHGAGKAHEPLLG